MRIISAQKITEVVANLCLQANLVLRKDVLVGLKLAYSQETNRRAKKILEAIVKNALIAKKEKLAICQDTGLPWVFIEMGQDLRLNGGLKNAINKGVELGYRRGFLRNSIVKDPLTRKTPGYLPAIIHTEIVRGDKLSITVLPKGFGCENKTQLKMFKPTVKIEEIKNFIINAVASAGPDACPPYIVGVGIGGTADYACLLAKKALLRKVCAIGYTLYAKLESDLLKQINKLNIGPMGLGGKHRSPSYAYRGLTGLRKYQLSCIKERH